MIDTPRQRERTNLKGSEQYSNDRVTPTVRSFGRALVNQYNVVEALVLRETRTRFGAHKLGYVWALAEPAIMIVTFYAMFRFSGRGAPGNVNLLSFLATGIVPYLLFSKNVAQVSQAINGNIGLLFYPQVKPLDVVLARVTLEFCTYALVFVLLMGVNVLFQRELEIPDPLLIVIGFALASLLGAGLGLVFMGLGQLSNLSDRARGPIMRPFFWISGLFFTTHSLPPKYREAVLYNPVLHLSELVREGWFSGYHGGYASISYVLVWVLGLFFVGLTLETATRRRIEVT